MLSEKKSVKLKPHLKIWPKKKSINEVDATILDINRRCTLLLKDQDNALNKFSQWPLSTPTLQGLEKFHYISPTNVQLKSLKHSLNQKNVIVEAKTGSGKTLAFVIPVLERLFAEKISQIDGPVALILTPTRELAKQILQVFLRVGKFHNFSMLDIMGGKTNTNKREEWQRIANANILIGTPGRFVQHQLENSTLDMFNLRMLVLDEADRLLDPTFFNDLSIIISNLPPQYQSMLFSATLSKSIKHMDYLHITSPVMISDSSESATPNLLIQSYSIVSLENKLDYLWTFLQSHCKKKIIVFCSTQKQVRFVHDLFLQLRPYYTVMQLRGNMLQSKRFKIYEKFSQTQRGAVLFATNVAERGLDFPEVHWVVQYDCPKQLDDYIHRVGRTARAEHAGRALTFLLPSESCMVDLLADRGIVIRQLQIPESQVKPYVSTRAPILLASQQELATSARSAFTAYLRDYCYVPKRSETHQPNSNKNKLKKTKSLADVFKISELPIVEFAVSLGLPTTPEVPKQLQCHIKKIDISSSKLPNQVSKVNWDLAASSVIKDESENDDLLQRKLFSAVDLNPTLKARLESTGGKLLDVVDSSSESEVDQLEATPTVLENSKQKSVSRIQLAKRELRKDIRSFSKIEFDEHGNAISKLVGGVPIDRVDDILMKTSNNRLLLDEERKKLKSMDIEDKARWQERVRAKHRLERKKLKEARKLEKPTETAILNEDYLSSQEDDDEEEEEEYSKEENDEPVDINNNSLESSDSDVSDVQVKRSRNN